MPSSICLVTGATGDVGPRVVDAFHSAGYHIRTFSRSAPEPGLLPCQTEAFVGDVTDPIAVQTATHDCELVVHLAALFHLTGKATESFDTYQRINTEGTATVVKAALESGVKRLVFFSTIAVYGQSASQVFDEGSPPQPDSFYARSKLEGERIVLEAKRHDGEALGAVLRMSAVYGTRIKGNYRRLLESLARKIFVPLGDGRNRRTLIYDRDAARAALLAARHPAAAGKIYNVTDGQYHSVEEIIRVICTSLGRNVPRVRLPVAPARRAVGILEDLARTTGIKLPIGRTTIDKYMEDLAVSGERIQRELGFQAEFDLVRGWAETILERRQAGKLGYYNSDSDRPR